MPERGDGAPAGVDDGLGEAAEVVVELLAVERDLAGADVVELRAQPVAATMIVCGVNGAQAALDVAVQRRRVEQRSATLPSASAWAL